MKKVKGLKYLLIFIFIVVLFSGVVNAFSGSGSGTSGDPYQITSCLELNETRDSLSAYYDLGNNIDCSDTINWCSGNGFEPIGDSSNSFQGSFNGAGYNITDFYINRTGEDYVGLFGYTNHAVINDSNLVNVNISGKERVGGLVGYAYSSNISYSYSTGSVSGTSNVGGLVGYGSGASICLNISSSYFTGNVSGTSNVGGLVGKANVLVIISSSYSTGNVSGTSNVGGLVGDAYCSIEISYSYSTGNVSGTSNVGGLVGCDWYSTVSSSYFTGSVSGTSNVGGLVGDLSSAIISSSYSTGSVSGTSNVGGLVGYGFGSSTCSNSFWDNQTSGQTSSALCNSGGRTTAEMKTKTTFTDAGWDFVNNWTIISFTNNGYPYLRWQAFIVIQVQSPLNQTYSTSTIYFNATADETIDTWIVNWNGTDTTLSSINTSLVVEDGSHHLFFYANDSSGNWGLNDSIYFIVDTTSPIISSFSCSPTSVYTGDVITCSCSATDNIDSSLTLSYTTNPDTSNTGTHTTSCTATDDAGNSASSSIDYVVEERGASPLEIPPEEEEEIPENGNGGSSGGGSSGGGGSSSSPGKLEEPKITIYVKLKQGETKTEEFTLTNIGTSVLNVSLNSDLEFLDFEKNLILNSKESKIVKVNISAKGDTTPYFYMGHIYATAPGIEKEVLVFVEVISKDSLFNVVLEAEKFVLPGEKVKANIFLERLNGFEEENITLNYLVKNIRGEEIVFENETMVVGDSLDFVKQIDIPQETRHGVYVLFVQAIDDEKIASDSDMFNVKFKEDRNWLLWVLVFILMVLAGIYIRNRIKEKKGK